MNGPVFQHTAARRRLRPVPVRHCAQIEFQHTAARRRLPVSGIEAASPAEFQHTAARRRLPPGLRPGATLYGVSTHSRPKAAAASQVWIKRQGQVSTHSRPKAAAAALDFCDGGGGVSTHSRPKAAAHAYLLGAAKLQVSTHSRPKAAAHRLARSAPGGRCFNTQPPEGGCPWRERRAACFLMFQHTAARRRLLAWQAPLADGGAVSTHSRPKAAATAK